MNRDPTGEFGALNLYGILLNAPVNDLDLLGQFGFTRNEKTIGTCGWFQTSVTFDGVADGKWIIQYVKKTRTFTERGTLKWNPDTKECDCIDCRAVEEEERTYQEFYEAFKKQPGFDKTDVSSGSGPHRCTSGEMHNQKMAISFGDMIENAETCPEGFTRASPNPTGGGTCYRLTKPDGWDTRKGAPSLVVRYGFKGKWDCCPSVTDTTVTDTTPSLDP